MVKNKKWRIEVWKGAVWKFSTKYTEWEEMEVRIFRAEMAARQQSPMEIKSQRRKNIYYKDTRNKHPRDRVKWCFSFVILRNEDIKKTFDLNERIKKPGRLSKEILKDQGWKTRWIDLNQKIANFAYWKSSMVKEIQTMRRWKHQASQSNWRSKCCFAEV